MKNNLYIYLARLDKKGIKVLTAFEYSKKIYPTKIRDVKELNLKSELDSFISKQFHENRMHYELYLETADSFNNLRSSLSKRGYSNLPLHQFTNYILPSAINDKNLISDSFTMLKRKSEIKQ